jgi:hypothetical protein
MDVFSRQSRVNIGGKVIAIISSLDKRCRHRGPGFEFEYRDGLYRCKKETHNIVTNDGDLYYAERAALLTTGTPISPVPTDFTDANGVPDMIMELYADCTTAPAKGNDRSSMAGGAVVTSSAQALESGYPKVNDTGDSDNTGDGVDIVTYTVIYTTGTLDDTGIDDVYLTNPSPGASENLLCHADGLGTLTITTADSLKVIINHQLNGV